MIEAQNREITLHNSHVEGMGLYLVKAQAALGAELKWKVRSTPEQRSAYSSRTLPLNPTSIRA